VASINDCVVVILFAGIVLLLGLVSAGAAAVIQLQGDTPVQQLVEPGSNLSAGLQCINAHNCALHLMLNAPPAKRIAV
jgi:hypothetical protein